MKTLLIFLTDGFADWEPSIISTELNKPELGFEVKTMAIDKTPKKSLGGLTVLPDYEIDEAIFESQDIACLIISGGTGWSEEKNQKTKIMVDACLQRQIPIAAICDAVTFLARHGYLDTIAHTGNTLEYLKMMAPNYKGDQYYIESQAVTGGDIITANGTGYLEFARDILIKLDIKPNVDWAHDLLKGLGVDPNDPVKGWYVLWKRGLYMN